MSPAKPLLVLGVLTVSACAVVPPSGPTVAAMPGQGKTLDQFRADDNNCRGYAAQMTSAAPGQAQAATNNSVAAAVGGTAVGAAAGALLGAAAGNAGAGAAIGAGAGLLAGSAAGANGAAYSQAGLQQNYNVAYAQCMTAAGEQVPPPGTAVAGYPGPYAYPYPYPPYGPAVVVEPTFGFGFRPYYGYGWRRW
jgi:hypothetical protein